MAAIIIIFVVSVIGHGWLRVALSPSVPRVDVLQAQRELQSRLRHAIFVSLFFLGLFALGIILHQLGIAPGEEMGLM